MIIRRPNGIPRLAVPAIVGIAVLLVFDPLVASVNWLVFSGDTLDYWNVMPFFVFGSPFVIVPFVVLGNRGYIWLLRLIRPLIYLVLAFYILNIFIAIVALSTIELDDSLLSAAGILLEALFLPLIFMMRRSLKTSRWLDPTSRPDEWETPARDDPNDPAYRRKKNRKSVRQLFDNP